jgi:hypothetical protein
MASSLNHRHTVVGPTEATNTPLDRFVAYLGDALSRDRGQLMLKRIWQTYRFAQFVKESSSEDTD